MKKLKLVRSGWIGHETANQIRGRPIVSCDMDRGH
jgi:hypothetical protein